MDRSSSDFLGLTVVERQAAGASLDDAFQRLGELAVLETDWDSYGADPPTLQAIAMAQELLHLVAGRLTPTAGERIRPWFIAPVADGGVQLEWRGPDRAVEIEIGPGGMIGYLAEEGREPDLRFEEGDDISLDEALGLVARVVTP